MNKTQYPIQWVARLTGLNAHAVRTWEPRYRDTPEKVGVLPIENLAQPGATLDNLRKPATKANQ
jgi:hypothetical protein